MSPRRILLGGLAALLLIVLVGLGGIVGLGATQTGSELLVRGLLWFVPGEARFQTLKGRLIDRMTLRELVFENPSMRIRIRRFELGWDPTSLTSWTVDFNRIRAHEIQIFQSPSVSSDEPWKPPSLYLPVSVEIGDFEATGFEYFSSGSPPSDLRLERVSFRGELGLRTTRIEQVRLRGPRVSLDLQGWVQPRGSYSMDLQVRWGWTPRDDTPYRGTGRLTGSLRELTLKQNLLEPVQLDVAGQVSNLLSRPRWSARTRFSHFNLGKVRDELSGVIVTGPVRGSGTLDRVRVRTQLTGSFRDWDNLSLSLDAVYESGTVRVDSAALSREGTPVELTAQGTVATEPFSVNLKGDWDNLRWPLQGEARIRSSEGSYRVEGTPEAYKLDVNGSLEEEPAWPAMQLEVRLAGDGRTLKINPSRVRVLEGTLAVSGRANLDDTPSWDVSVSGQGINPAGRYTDWPGALDFRGQVQGRYGEELRLDLEVPRLSGRLRGQPLQGELNAALRGNRYRVRRFELVSREARLRLDGQVGPELDGSWSVRIPRISVWWAAVEGTIKGEGRLGGTLSEPALSGTLDGESLSWQQLTAQKLEASFALDQRSGQTSRLEVTGQDLNLRGQSIQRVELSGSGVPREHTLKGDLSASWGSAQFRLAGGWEQGTWRGKLENMGVTHKRLGHWGLQEPSRAIVSPDRYTLAHSCFSSEAARLCGSVSGSPSRVNVSASLESLSLDRLNPWVTETMQIAGVLEGRTQIHYESGPGWSGTGEFSVNDGGVTLTTQFEDPTEIRYKSLSVETRLQGDRLTAAGSVEFPEQGRLQADFELTNPLGPSAFRQKPLSLKLQGELNSLQVMDLVSDDLQWRGGQARARVQVSGTVNRPEFGGQFSLQETQVRIYPLGITLNNVRMEGHSSNRGDLVLEGSAESGGRLNLTGRIRPATEGPWSFEVRANGENFRLIDLPEAQVDVNPDLELSGNPPKLSLRGRLGVPRARITQGIMGRTEAVEVSRDVVIVSERPEPAGKPGLTSLDYWELTSEVTVSLGPDISINLPNFSGSLTGDLVVREQPGRPTTGEGTLTISEGSYEAYGQALSIEDGQVVFARTPLTNPRISLSAVRRVRDQDVLVGVRVRGTLEQPELTLFSEPTMSQTNVLSYLVLGRPTSDATGSSAQLLMRAASSVGLQGGDMLVSRIAEQFGLSGVRLESEAGFQGSALVLGRYLSPRLYVSYGLGLFEASNVLQFRYRLDEHWSIQGEGGERTSADLIYSIQR